MTSAPAPVRAGLIGLGIIGGGVARSLRTSGHTAVGYDVRPAALTALDGVISPGASPADVAARSEVVHLAVLDLPQILDVLEGPDGVLAGARPGTTIVVLSTISPAAIPDLVSRGARAGVVVLDCGVIGSDDRAAFNALVATLGGAPHDVARVLPTLEAWAGRVVHCGPVGSGMTVKVGRNALTFGMWRALEEVTRTMMAAGVGQHEFIEAMRLSDPQGEYVYRQRSLIGGFELGSPERQAAIDHGRAIMTKDLAGFADLAREWGVATPLIDVVAAQLDDSLDAHVATPSI